MKSLLTISWWFPPLLGPRSIQVAKSLDSLAKRGWKVTAIASTLKSLPLGQALDHQLLDRYCRDVRILRVANPLISPLAQIARKVNQRWAPMPDQQVYWARRAAQSVEAELDFSKFDVLASFGQPWSSHVLGKQVAEQSGLPWLAHFSDPWADNPYNASLLPVQRERMAAMEGATVRAAHRLLFTNQPTVELVMGKYDESEREKVRVIPHGFDSSLSRELPTTAVEMDPSKLSFLHAGNIYGIRDPMAVFNALQLLKQSPAVFTDLDFVFLGAISQKTRWEQTVKDMGVEEVVRFEGRVGYFESLAIVGKADVLVVLDAASEGASVFLPSKLVDYLGLSKTILGITPQEGVTASLLSSLQMPIAAPNDPHQIAQRVSELHASWKDGRLAFGAEQSKTAAGYAIEATTDLLEETLLEMTR